MAHLVGETGFFHSGNTVAAADDGDTAIGFDFSNRIADAESTFVEFLHFEAAHRSVPDNSLGGFDGFAVKFDSFRTDIEAHPVVIDIETDNFGVGFGIEFVGFNAVDGEQEFDTALVGFSDHFAGIVHLVGFAERITDLVTLGSEESINHTAADDEGIDLGQQVADNCKFVESLMEIPKGSSRESVKIKIH